MPTVLFAWRRTPPPFLIGGAEVSQQLLAEEFAVKGWRVVYLGAHESLWDQPSQLEEMRRELTTKNMPQRYDDRRAELRYTCNGVECRGVTQADLNSAFDAALRELRPDLVITSQEGSADLAERARNQTLVAGWLHSVSRTGMHVLEGRPHYALAVSRFVMSRTPDAPRTEQVLFYPPFADTSSASTLRTNDILMVNPVPDKGSELIHKLADRLPERRFTLVEGWWDTSAEFARHPNVRYLQRTYDMQSLYAQHQMLLVPSTVEDAFPRVIIEAGLQGLPSIGSEHGGIPEAIGNAGLLAPPDDVEAWIDTIRAAEAQDTEELGQRAHARSMELARECLPELAAAGVIPD